MRGQLFIAFIETIDGEKKRVRIRGMKHDWNT